MNGAQRGTVFGSPIEIQILDQSVLSRAVFHWESIV